MLITLSSDYMYMLAMLKTTPIRESLYPGRSAPRFTWPRQSRWTR